MRRLTLLGLVVSVPVHAQRVRYEGGLQVSSGKYLFTEATTTLSLVTGFSVVAGPVTLRASWPIWLQNNRLITSSGIGALATGGTRAGPTVRDSSAARRIRRAGRTALSPPSSAITDYAIRPADPMLQLAGKLVSRGVLSLSVYGSVKPPVTDTGDFGTGQWDVGAGVSAAIHSGSTMIGLEASYWHFGDLPAVNFRDIGGASLSVGRLTGSGWGVTANVAASTTIITEYAPPVAVGAGISRIGRRGTWGLIGSVGLTEMAPDLSLGTFWSLRL